VLIETFKNISSDLKVFGHHVFKDDSQNKLETIVKIAQFSA
jgi:hypothetical protein